MSGAPGHEPSDGEEGERSPSAYEPFVDRQGSLGGYGSARASRSPAVNLRPGGNAGSASSNELPLPAVPTQFDEEPASPSSSNVKNAMVVTPGTRKQPESRHAASHEPSNHSRSIRRIMNLERNRSPHEQSLTPREHKAREHDQIHRLWPWLFLSHQDERFE